MWVAAGQLFYFKSCLYAKIQAEEAAPSWDMKFLWQRERTRGLALKLSVALKACAQSCLCYIQSHPIAQVCHLDQAQHQ